MKNCRVIRVLLSEGSSLSARQAITALGQCGYTLDICDPNPQCISRFSRFVRRYYRCPAAGTDPIGYLRFMLHLLTRERYDVLLPVHEQAFLFAKVQDRLKSGAGVALAPFDAFLQVQGKVAFAHLMQRLSLPTPSTSIIGSRVTAQQGRESGVSRIGWSWSESAVSCNDVASSEAHGRSLCRPRRQVCNARSRRFLHTGICSPLIAPRREA